MMSNPTGDALRANSIASIKGVLERIWKYNSQKAENLGYELVVLAVPKSPANIEAISSIDLATIADVLQCYVDSIRGQHEKRASGASPQRDL